MCVLPILMMTTIPSTTWEKVPAAAVILAQVMLTVLTVTQEAAEQVPPAKLFTVGTAQTKPN